MGNNELTLKAANKLGEATDALRSSNIESRIRESVLPVERAIERYPTPSVLVAAGVGILAGVLIGIFASKK